MSKKILVVENSLTVQKIFTKTLDNDDYNLKFESNLNKIVDVIFDFVPDILLLNTEYDEPSSFDYVKLIRTIPCFQNLAIGMYTNSESSFDEEYALSSGANTFVRLEPKTLFLNVDELSEISTAEKVDKVNVLQTKKDYSDKILISASLHVNQELRVKNKITQSIFNMIEKISSVEEVVSDFLSFLAELTHSPAVGIYLVENDEPKAYVLFSEKLTEVEREDFQKVCKTDFENLGLDSSLSMLVPNIIQSKINIDSYKLDNVPLSSYLNAKLSNEEKGAFGTIHILKCGNISNEQNEFFNFCADNASLLFSKVLMLKEKIIIEKYMRKAFSMFVPEQVIDEYVAEVRTKSNGGEAKIAVGEKRPVAVLFSDIRSFTNISECNKPEVMVAFLNRYFTIMSNIIKKHGGTIDKFIGDAIMALFGAPISFEDNTRRAVAAAYEMREALPSVPLGDLILPDGMSFDIGIGINYGAVTVGSLGSEDRKSYTVIGDDVNLASRLEGLTKTYGSRILVSDSVKKDIEDCGYEKDFVFRSLDDVRVKGKANAVPIYGIDESEDTFPTIYRDSYMKGMLLYKQGVFNLAKEYFEKCLEAVGGDKAAKLMLSRCIDFIKNPPENWDGAIKFTTK